MNERKKMMEQHAQAANTLMSEVNEARDKREISITDLDFSKYEDQKIVLQILLRGKTVDEYFSIVQGLFTAFDGTRNKEEREKLHNLAAQVMEIGESNLGIDWS